MHMYPSLPQTARFSPHREYESVRLLAGAQMGWAIFKAVLAHSAAFDGPWAVSVSACSKRQNYRAACAANEQHGPRFIPFPLFPLRQAPASWSFASGTLNLLLAKGFKAHFALRNDSHSRGIMRFFAIARYANSRKTKFSTANTVRYTGIIPMPTYCWIKPNAVGIKVLPI